MCARSALRFENTRGRRINTVLVFVAGRVLRLVLLLQHGHGHEQQRLDFHSRTEPAYPKRFAGLLY